MNIEITYLDDHLQEQSCHLDGVTRIAQDEYGSWEIDCDEGEMVVEEIISIKTRSAE